MQRLLFTLIAGLTAIVFASGSFLIYLQHENINTYAKQVLGIKQKYSDLEKEYEKIKAATPAQTNGQQARAADPTSEPIAIIIDKYVAKTNDSSVYYKNLSTDTSITVNPDKKYYMASLYKIILVLYMLDEIENGNASLTDRVGTSSATLDFAIDKIITESNNEYAQTLAQKYGWKNIEKAMRQKLGIEFSFDDDLEISVKNMGKLFEEIAKPSKLTEDHSRTILTLLSNQKKTNKLPKYLPKHIYSHNKTGEFEAFSHDAAIFYTPRANYILIFMSESKNPAATDEQMALMSKEIYETLNPILK